MKKLIIAALGFAIGLFGAAAAYSPQAATYTPQRLYEGWNLISGNGDAPELFAARYPCVTAIYGWDAQAQRWTSWFPGVPAYVNAQAPIGTLSPAGGYWVFCNGDPAPAAPPIRLIDIYTTHTEVSAGIINAGNWPYRGDLTLVLVSASAPSSINYYDFELNPGASIRIALPRPNAAGEARLLLYAGSGIADEVVLLLPPAPTATPTPIASTPTPSMTPAPSATPE